MKRSLSTPALTTYFAMDDAYLSKDTEQISCDRYYYYSKTTLGVGEGLPCLRNRPFHGPGGEWGERGASQSEKKLWSPLRLLNLGHLHSFSSLRGCDRRRLLSRAIAVGGFARPRPNKPVHGNSYPVTLGHPLLGACTQNPQLVSVKVQQNLFSSIPEEGDAVLAPAVAAAGEGVTNVCACLDGVSEGLTTAPLAVFWCLAVPEVVPTPPLTPATCWPAWFCCWAPANWPILVG